MKIKMKKKIVALCLFALIVGIATALPLAYITPRITDPWFNIDIPYANVIPHTRDANGAVVNVVANFSLTPAGISTKGADAKIEVFNFHVYSDKASIANIIYGVRRYGNVSDSKAPDGVNSAITGSGTGGVWFFADGSSYNLTNALGVDTKKIYSSGVFNFDGTGISHTAGWGSAVLSEADREESSQALADLKEASTLYVDITRIMTITYKHQTVFGSSLSATTMDNSKVLCHVELSKTSCGFASGHVPDFMQFPDDFDSSTQRWWWSAILPPSAVSATQATLRIDTARWNFPKVGT